MALPSGAVLVSNRIKVTGVVQFYYLCLRIQVYAICDLLRKLLETGAVEDITQMFFRQAPVYVAVDKRKDAFTHFQNSLFGGIFDKGVGEAGVSLACPSPNNDAVKFLAAGKRPHGALQNTLTALEGILFI